MVDQKGYHLGEWTLGTATCVCPCLICLEDVQDKF